MVSYAVLRKLSSARNSAGDAGLGGTAERLDILRRRLAEYKDIPAEGREKRLRWAAGKVEDTRETLRKELCAMGDETRREIEHRSGDGAILAKGAGFLAFAWLTFRAIDAIEDHAFLLIAGGIAAFTAFTGFIDNFIGPVSFEKTKNGIEDALSQCARAIERRRDGLKGIAACARPEES
ncbi:MAG TPA: hypothetical protein VLD37_04035 [Candidatus Bilamarchaeum sp.]|nr:hypothetical protein [Candidatus Bilamarchaeum sp.]